MTPKQFAALLSALLFAAFLGAGGYFAWSYHRMAGEVAELKPLKNQVVELQRQQKTLSDEVIRRDEFDSALRSRTDTIHIQLDKVTNEDPAARDYLGERIPDSVRQAASPRPAER